MAADFSFHIEPLGDQDRAAFLCGVDVLDQYIRNHASQDVRKRIAACFVLIDEVKDCVAGFYSLAATAILANEIPPELAKHLPKYPRIPATLIGRLAVDLNYPGLRLGEFILMDALRRSATSSKHIASIAVVVDAKDDKAVGFYQKYDFIPFPDQPRRLFIPMKTIEALFKTAR